MSKSLQMTQPFHSKLTGTEEQLPELILSVSETQLAVTQSSQCIEDGKIVLDNSSSVF